MFYFQKDFKNIEQVTTVGNKWQSLWLIENKQSVFSGGGGTQLKLFSRSNIEVKLITLAKSHTQKNISL